MPTKSIERRDWDRIRTTLSTYFNLPISDSFQLFGRIYKLSPSQITRRQKELSRLFDLEDFIDTPVRKLSLGQRMRAEIAVALIHRPTMIFLDEPTIGLDVVAKRALRNVLHSLNKEQGTTLFLTSHDTGDIEALCERTIVVNHGKLFWMLQQNASDIPI